jgi:hypothetical protein
MARGMSCREFVGKELKGKNVMVEEFEVLKKVQLVLQESLKSSLQIL